MKVRLLRQLSAASRVKPPSGLQGPPQAHQFISLLLEEYGALCQAARTISSFLGTLVRRHVCRGPQSVKLSPARAKGGARGLLPSFPSLGTWLLHRSRSTVWGRWSPGGSVGTA